MSNLFQEVLTDPKGVEERLLGPSYPYYKNIKSPSEIGMSDKGTIQQMGKNINGVIQYVELLVSGKSQASTTGGPLGDKFYINNVPQGNIPFISSGLGVDFSDFKGLIPGALGNLNVLNPFAITSAFLSGSTPPCQEITMQTIDINNNKSSETNYVTLTDIKNMDPCIFPDGKNPVTGAKCKEGFKTGVSANASPVMSDDIMDQIYFVSLSCVGIYILYRIMEKSK
jgi:hypothetical protein